MSDEMKGCAAIGVIGVGAIGAVALVGWGLGWFDLVTSRPMAKYNEQTRKEVYDTSRQYQQGTNRDIARYCEQMRDTSQPAASRKAVAALIRTTNDTYDGDLSSDNEACVAEAKGN